MHAPAIVILVSIQLISLASREFILLLCHLFSDLVSIQLISLASREKTTTTTSAIDAFKAAAVSIQLISLASREFILP